MRKIQLPLEEIKRKYEEGYSSKQISKLYTVSQTTIERRLHKIGVKVRKHTPVINESIITKAERIYFNNKHISLEKLSKKLRISREGLRYRLAKRGVKIRSSAEMTTLGNKKRSKKIDLNKELDCNFAYIWGVLYGDGHISQEGIHLSCNDKDFISAFTKAVENWTEQKCFINKHLHRHVKVPNGKIYHNVNAIRANFYSAELSRWLNEHFGPFYSKTWKLDVGRIMGFGKEFCYSFLKGLFDSDSSWRLHLVAGNLKGLNGIRELLIKLGFHPTKIVRGDTCYYIRLNSYKDRLNYYNKIGFSIERKRKKLENWLKNHTDIHTARLNNIKKAIEHNKKQKKI